MISDFWRNCWNTNKRYEVWFRKISDESTVEFYLFISGINCTCDLCKITDFTYSVIFLNEHHWGLIRIGLLLDALIHLAMLIDFAENEPHACLEENMPNQHDCSHDLYEAKVVLTLLVVEEKCHLTAVWGRPHKKHAVSSEYCAQQ